MLKLLDFIRNNTDWEDQLSNDPYYINIKRSEGYIMFSYGIEADFRMEVVRECR